jgi:hypothetical protein
MSDFNIYYPFWDIHGRLLRGSSKLAAYILRWNMILYIPFGELIRYKHDERSFITNLAWATANVVINYYKDLGLVGSDYKAQLVSIEVAFATRGIQQPEAEGWNWTMMRNNIIEVEAAQRLSSIAAAKDTLMAIDAAFNNLMKKFITIADLSTFKRKSGIGKGCPWWNPRVKAAVTTAKREYRSYIASSTDYRWNRYKKAKAHANKTIEAAKSNNWRRAIAAMAYD